MPSTRAGLAVGLLCGVAVLARAEAPAKDWTPVTVEGEDVAAVSATLLPKGTRIRLTVTAREGNGLLRLGDARKVDAPINAMVVWNTPDIDETKSESVRNDAFICIAVGPKDSPLKLLAVEPKAGHTELRFEGGWVVQVEIVPPRPPKPAASQPK